MTAEHLMAIVLQTGRAKDHARLVRFLEAGIADMEMRDTAAVGSCTTKSRSCVVLGMPQ